MHFLELTSGVEIHTAFYMKSPFPLRKRAFLHLFILYLCLDQSADTFAVGLQCKGQFGIQSVFCHLKKLTVCGSIFL